MTLQMTSELSDTPSGAQTLCEALAATAASRPDQPAYSDRIDGDRWRTVTWYEVRDQALSLAAAFIDLGVEPGDSVAIMASNRLEHVLSDIAAVHAGAEPSSIYLTLSADQIEDIASRRQPAVVVVENLAALACWQSATESLGRRPVFILLNGEAEGALEFHDALARGRELREAGDIDVDARWKAIPSEQAVTVLYTSGTTGAPKGVVLNHRNVLCQVAGSRHAAGFTEPGLSVSYLPFAHIAERLLSIYIPQVEGGHVYLLHDLALLPSALAEIRPTRFFGVPRVWEKLKMAASAALSAEQDPERRAAAEAAMAVGRRHVESLQTGAEGDPADEHAYARWDSSVLQPIRERLGLGRVGWAASAAAPMPGDVAAFFAGLGIPIYDVYGMTETTAAVTANGPGRFKIGTVGRAIPGVEIRIAADGEILARGPVATPGYRGNEEATRELIDPEGWVHTGDLGRLEDGFLTVVDRKKEIIVTSSGKNVAPSNIEGLLKQAPLVGHALVHGDDRPYLVALIALDPEVAPVVADRLGVAPDLDTLAKHPAVQQMVAEGVAAANARLSRPEQVKRFDILSAVWLPGGDELTPTMKVRRKVVQEKYADVIDRLYAPQP